MTYQVVPFSGARFRRGTIFKLLTLEFDKNLKSCQLTTATTFLMASINYC